MSAFHEVRFPVAVSHGASGGPERRTRVVSLSSGQEERNSPWANSRRKWDAGIGVRDTDDIEAVASFFEGRRGRLHGFRWKDWSDWRSGGIKNPVTPLDQTLAIADGTASAFQLRKVYSPTLNPWYRDITKPIPGSVKIAVDGVPVAEGAGFTVDTATGIVTLATAPADGAEVTAGFRFDVPVRFDTDELVINMVAFNAGEIPSIPVIEIRV